MKGKESFKKRFEKIRVQSGLRYSEIAEKAGISKQSLSQIISVGNPRAETLEKIAEAMNVNASVFFI